MAADAHTIAEMNKPGCRAGSLTFHDSGEHARGRW